MEHVSSTLDPSSDWLSHQSIYIDVMGRASFLLRAAAADTEEAEAAARQILAVIALRSAWNAIEQREIWPRLVMLSSSNYSIMQELRRLADTSGLPQVKSAAERWMANRQDYQEMLNLCRNFEEQIHTTLSCFKKLGLPAIQHTFTDDLWNQMQADVCDSIDPELRMLVLGMVLATKTSQGRDKLVAALSASLKAEWLNSGLVAFNRHQNLLSMITGEEGID